MNSDLKFSPIKSPNQPQFEFSPVNSPGKENAATPETPASDEIIRNNISRYLNSGSYNTYYKTRIKKAKSESKDEAGTLDSPKGKHKVNQYLFPTEHFAGNPRKDVLSELRRIPSPEESKSEESASAFANGLETFSWERPPAEIAVFSNAMSLDDTRSSNAMSLDDTRSSNAMSLDDIRSSSYMSLDDIRSSSYMSLDETVPDDIHPLYEQHRDGQHPGFSYLKGRLDLHPAHTTNQNFTTEKTRKLIIHRFIP